MKNTSIPFKFRAKSSHLPSTGSRRRRRKDPMMLKGRESLIRLIGKRRRFLSNRSRIRSSPTQSSLSLFNDRNSEAGAANRVESELRGSCGIGAEVNVELVTCPVCGNRVSGEQYRLNSHLDTCLPRGTKRKLTQRSLLQFNFSADGSRSSKASSARKASSPTSPGDDVVYKNDVPLASCSMVDRTESLASGLLVDYGGKECRFLKPYGIDSIMHNDRDDSLKEHNVTNKANDGVSTTSPKEKMMPLHEGELVDGITKTVLETYIVGRRFCDESEIKVGDVVSFLRDSDNDKDKNAIKVVDATDRCRELGFLPKNLAQYLSPLIDEYQLLFQGCVTSVPKNPLDVVPIEMACQPISCHKIDLQKFASFWENALNCVNSGKKFPPSIAKYQHNFLFIMEEVLRSNQHLFTDDERKFLESFSSLSDDDQRLFVRLDTRKGPWFRMSNISYPEILDSQQAAKTLCGLFIW